LALGWLLADIVGECDDFFRLIISRYFPVRANLVASGLGLGEIRMLALGRPFNSK
jgi:hypothetical protein